MASMRRVLVVVPLAALVALITHTMRFGNEHEFGMGLHGLIVDATLGGIAALGVAAFARALCSSREADGTVVAARLRDALPAGGAIRAIAPLIASLASAIYFGIEATEPHGDGPNALAFILAVALSFVVAVAIGIGVQAIASVALALMPAGNHRGRSGGPPLRRLAPVILTASSWEAGGRRFGRGPPG